MFARIFKDEYHQISMISLLECDKPPNGGVDANKGKTDMEIKLALAKKESEMTKKDYTSQNPLHTYSTPTFALDPNMILLSRKDLLQYVRLQNIDPGTLRHRDTFMDPREAGSLDQGIVHFPKKQSSTQRKVPRAT